MVLQIKKKVLKERFKNFNNAIAERKKQPKNTTKKNNFLSITGRTVKTFIDKEICIILRAENMRTECQEFPEILKEM